jgi:hypothetical protein
MTPEQLLERPHLRFEPDLSALFGHRYSHVPEVATFLPRDQPLLVPGVELRMYKDHAFDGRRIWRLTLVWLWSHSKRDDEPRGPVMVIRNAGREGDDHASRYVFDVRLYDTLIDRLCSNRHIAYAPRLTAASSLVGWCASRDEDEYASRHQHPTRVDDFYGFNLDTPEPWTLG